MRKLASLFIALLLIAPVVAAEEEFGEDFDNTLEQIESAGKKINELIEKYEKKELPVIKEEDVTIVDQNGNGVACEFEVYYSNYMAFKMNTGKDGKYSGTFDHEKQWPGKPISFIVHDCACRVQGRAEHTVTMPAFDVHIEKIKGVISDEVKDYAGDKAKEAAEKLVEKGFESAGASNLAGPFLWGFGVGADLGKPFGEALTNGINNILEARKNIRKAEHEAGLIAPRGARKTARWNIPVVNWFRTKPVIKNTWKVNVYCAEGITGDYSSANWKDYTDYGPKPLTPPRTTGRPKVDEELKRQEEEKAAAQRRWEEQQRKWEEERKQREEEARRKREEEKKKREAELKRKVAEIKAECEICDPIKEKIEETQKDIDELEDAIKEQREAVEEAQKAKAAADRALEQAERELSDFQNPSSWAESEGRRVTSSDLAIDRMVAREAWSRYSSGEINAQELENEWKNYDDEARERAKKQYEEQLEQAVKDAQQKAGDAGKALDTAKSALSQSEQQLLNLKKALEQLHKDLEECLKKCKEYAEDIAKYRILDHTELLEWGEEEESTRPTTGTTQMTDCEKYETLIKKYRLTVEDYEQYDSLILEEMGVTQSAQKAIASYKENCDQLKEVMVEEEQKETTVQQREDIIEQPKEQKSCEELCADRGMSTQQKNWDSYILNELNTKGTCAASASVGYSSNLRVGDCYCYSQEEPTISISSEKLVCSGGPCGDVACGETVECSCGENCITTASCNWGGWKKISGGFKPTVG